MAEPKTQEEVIKALEDRGLKVIFEPRVHMPIHTEESFKNNRQPICIDNVSIYEAYDKLFRE